MWRAGRAEVPIARGYCLYRADSLVALCDGNGMGVVLPQVVAIGLESDLIVGRTSGLWKEELPRASVLDGYFVLETSTSTLHSGLTFQQFETWFSARGVKPPGLSSPRVWAMWR